MFARPSVKGNIIVVVLIQNPVYEAKCKGGHKSYCPNSKIMFMRPSAKGSIIAVVLIQKPCL